MDILRAKEILKTLADGVNPITGEVLPAEDSCNQPDVIRALHAVLEKLPEKKKAQPENAGAKWTDEEISVLTARFDSGMPTAQIAKLHGRTKGAIESKLVALGKMERTYFPREKKE